MTSLPNMLRTAAARNPAEPHLAPRMQLLLAGLIVTAFVIGLLPHQTVRLDDAFIFQSYVRNALDGNGLVYAPGDWVEGYSSPLWVLILVGAGRLGAASFLADKLIGAAFGAAACALLALVPVPRRQWWWLLGAGLVLVMQPPLLWFSSVAMETPLLAFLLALIAVGMLNRWLFCVAAAAALVAITRPEGPMYTALAAIWMAGEGRSRGYSSVRLLMLGCGVLLPALAWEIYRLHAYHALLANAAFAKLGRPAINDAHPSGIDYLVGSFANLRGAWVLFLAGTIAALAGLRRGGYAVAEMNPVLMTVLMVAGGSFFAVAVRGDWMPWSRFLVPLVPLMAIVPASQLVQLTPLRQRFAAAVLVLAGVLSLMQLRADFASANPRPAWPQSIASLAQPINATGSQVYLASFMLRYTVPGDTVLHFDLGQSGYFAGDLQLIDQFGLVSRYEAEYLHSLHSSAEMEQHLRQLSPSVVFFLLNRVSLHSEMRIGEVFEDTLTADYAVVDRRPWWGNAELMVFVRKNALARTIDPKRLGTWQSRSPDLLFGNFGLRAGAPGQP